ncbi:polymorphic toxin-type HINT domain-containing protein [Streptomyces sp. NPDC005209]|uniref:polymorphic toxin-type HINT domain-containing protein n=1 Tax=Streptomyces sp. NPDC005209 TaxID=3156715 RepID=UPI0033B89453
MAARRARLLSVGVAGAVLAGLLSTVWVVSPQQASAAGDDPTPLVPSQSLGTVAAQQAEEAGKALPAPKWPEAAEATVDLSQAAPGDPGAVTAQPTASAGGDATEVADVVEVAPVADEPGATAQLSRTQLADEDTPSPTPSAADSAEATASSSAPASASDEASASASVSASPQPSDTASAPSADDAPETVSPDQVDVRVLDRQGVAPAGGVGLGLQVTRTDGVTSPGQVQVAIDYSGFRYAYGGDFASRLRLVKMPACALQTPEAEGCTDRESVPADNDTAMSTLTATVQAEPDSDGLSAQLASGSGSVYAVTTGSSSDKGDYRASTLSPTGSWDVATGSGAFTYSMPVSVPAPAMGTAPSLALSYNSQSVDGRTSATNNQSSWVGMGWDLGVGYIERRYRNCSDDGLKSIGDMCWDSPNTAGEPDGAVYVISLNGVTSTLVQDNNGTGSYHVQDDPGWRVQHLTTGGHGADDEYWVISSQDGQRYYFGWGRSERTGDATGSVFTEPVVGNNVGEPCHDQFPEPCTQAWRWNLDRTVDANEVESVYFYDKETNYYRSVATTDKARAYTASGYLASIEYGWPTQIPNSKPTGKVDLTHVGRCVERMSDADPLRSEPGACPSIASKPTSYPDVPVDLMCDGTSADYYCAGKTYYPTFFSKDMLWDIKTYVLNTSANGWDLVQQYQTKHGLPNPDGSIGKTLWLDYVQRKTYGTGTNIVLPVINFNGTDLDNKVGSTELNFRRISTIHGDLGATTTVTYGSPNPCSATDLPTESTNTKDCFWQKWTPEGETEARKGWFKKFLVTKVTVDPTVTSNQDGAPEMTTSYDYQGGAGWRFTNDPLVADDDESWSDWRGYQRVEVTTGSGSVKHSTFHWLYRGLDGDRTSKSDPSQTRSVSVTDGEGTSYTDSPWLQGRTIETSRRDDAGASHEHVFHHYWTHNTAQYDGLPDARFVREDETTTDTKISTGWRTHIVQDEYDDATDTSAVYGMPVRTDDQGEQGVADNQCTTYGRAYNTDLYAGSSIQRWMVLIDETRHYDTAGGSCASRSAANQDGYSTVLFDNATSVDTDKPVDGNPTETRTYASSGSTDYQKVTLGYDGAGRIIWTQDADSHRTTTAYAPDNVWPLDGVTIATPDPDGLAGARTPLTTTVWKSRFWGVPTQTKDANGNITKVTLDAAGRATEVWRPTETGSSPSMKFSYSVPTSTSGGVPDSVDGYPRVSTSTLQSGTTYLSSYAYTDGLGRARETQTPLPDGTNSSGTEVPNRQVAVSRYDSAGNVTGTSAVFRSEGTAGSGGPVSPKVEDLPSYTDLTLDWAGRTTLSQTLVGDGTTSRGIAAGKVQRAYFGDYTTVTPAVAAPTDNYSNVYGQTSKVVEHNGTSTFTTQYAYTASGALKQITDPRGNTTLYTYDWAGNRTKTDDPDAGISTTTYDKNGRISTVSNNVNPTTGWAKTTLTYAYDALGRKTSVSSGSTELAAWTWDGLWIAGGKGQITATTSHDADGNTYTVSTGAFDSRGRPLSSTISIPANVSGLAGTYTTTYGYDAADHITSVKYPPAGGLAEETVNTTYNAYGQPKSLSSDAGTYVKTTVYDAYGLLTDRYYGTPGIGANSVTAQRNYSYDYTNGTRWLTGITTTTTVGPYNSDSQQDTYSYDNDGKITQIREHASGQTAQSQCFRYDDQSRLTDAYTRTRSIGVCDWDNHAEFGGEAPYQTAYTYDRLGNLQSTTDTDATGKATTRDYLYPGYNDAGTWTTANSDWPHGVRKINTISAGTTTATETFTYDDAGQMTQHVEPGKTADYTWTQLGQLATAKTTDSGGSKLTRYTYDADGNLLVRTTPQETVAYLGGMELRTTNGPTATATRYYTCGTSTVAMRTTTGNTTAGGKLTYLMADTQASTQLAVDATTGTTSRRRYTPFGDERSGTLPTGTSNGFLGKTEDTSTGLSLLGARAYDPHLGRFLSPDPLSAPYNPQGLSAYTYSLNNPTNFSDPTGLWCDGCNDGNGWTTPDGNGKGGGNGNNDATPTATDLGNGEAPPLNQDLGRKYLGGDGQPTVSQMQAKGTYMPYVSLELNYELYFRERCSFSQGTDMTCKNLRDYYSGWKHVKDIEATDTCPICGNVGFDIILDYLLTRGGCVKNSFLPEQGVRMADGTVKEIQDVKVGDKVLATDPETGKTEARTVLATIITKEDKDFTEITVKSRKAEHEIIATAHHPFWSPSKRAWIDADDLEPGTTLRSDSGAEVSVVRVRDFRESHDTRNLTVDGLHTYYVLAGSTPILVHNCDGAVDWVAENASKPGAAQAYEDAAVGARSRISTQTREAPALDYINPSGQTRQIRFDGFDEVNGVLIDRKMAVTTFNKSYMQARNQSLALEQNGYTGRWEVPTAAEAARARKLLGSLSITNIRVRVVP